MFGKKIKQSKLDNILYFMLWSAYILIKIKKTINHCISKIILNKVHCCLSLVLSLNVPLFLLHFFLFVFCLLKNYFKLLNKIAIIQL